MRERKRKQRDRESQRYMVLRYAYAYFVCCTMHNEECVLVSVKNKKIEQKSETENNFLIKYF